MNNTSWDSYFMGIVDAVAVKSKDDSTKVGCIIVGPDKEIRSTGFNGMPRGVNDDALYRHERPEKYFWFEHAERNAIYLAARHGVSLQDCSLYVGLTPCADCARVIIQSGINDVILKTLDVSDRWKESTDRALTMFMEAGVNVRVARP